VANMYFLPIGLLVKSFAPAEFWQSISSTPGDWSSLTLSATVVNNLLPVTIGNIIGGAGMVGLVYWFVYLRKRSRL
jgi:formate transporter